MLRETAAGMRYLNTGSPADQTRYDVLADEADRLRRDAIKLEALSAVEREKLKDLGTLQATVEAGIGAAHAYQAVGRSADATGMLGRIASALDQVDKTLELLRQEGARRLTDRQAEAAVLLRRNLVLLAVAIVAALAVGIFSSITTSRAVTRPMAALTRDLLAIGRGDLRQSDLKRATMGTAEYETLATAFDQARDRLRGLLGEMKRQSDDVAAAAAELAEAAGGASSSTQHVATAVTEMAHGAGLQLDVLTGAGNAVSQLAASGKTIEEAVQESQLRGREIPTSATSTAQEICRAVGTLLAAREGVDRSAREIQGPPGQLGGGAQVPPRVSRIASQ